jgi:hypothetical protein
MLFQGHHKMDALLTMTGDDRQAFMDPISPDLPALDQISDFRHMVIFVTHMRILTTWYFAF